MTRRTCLYLALPLAACRTQQPFPSDMLPDTMPGGWRRTSMGEFSGARDPVPANSVEQSRAATYEGPGTLEVHIYQLTSPAIGLDLTQRWRPSADTVFF